MKKLTRKQARKLLIEQAQLLAMPPDYESACAAGILEKVGKKKHKYKVLDITRLPPHLASRAKSIGGDPGGGVIVEFKDSTRFAKKLLSQLQPEAEE
jgi:hypothetical protein